MSDIDELAARRKEMEVAIGEVGDRLAASEGYDLASSTLAGRVGAWERGDREASPEDLDAYEDVLETIQAERDFEYPDCARCGRTPEFEPDVIDGESYCIICGETIELERRRERMEVLLGGV